MANPLANPLSKIIRIAAKKEAHGYVAQLIRQFRERGELGDDDGNVDKELEQMQKFHEVRSF